jgi:hypothetical protein
MGTLQYVRTFDAFRNVKGRQSKRYIISAITAMLPYALTRNASTYSYRSGNIRSVIASDYNCSEYMTVMRRFNAVML